MSQTGIGRTGQTHILTTGTDDPLYLFVGTYWSIYPLAGDAFINTGDFTITAGSTIVTGASTLFTLLCNNFNNSNTPLNKYIAYTNGSVGYGILEVDYVIDDVTLILKTPAFETVNTNDASQINYYGTPILKEVLVNTSVAGVPQMVIIGSKYDSISDVPVGEFPFRIANEGGIEPLLIDASTSRVTLNY